MVYIITRPTGLESNSYDPYKTSLKVGEAYEDFLVAELRRQGIDAYRPSQAGLLRVPHLVQTHEYDVFVKATRTRRYPIEVVSRRNCWKFPTIYVGSEGKWDSRKHVKFLVVICQNTGDTRITNVDVERWQRVRAKYGEISYSVPRHAFAPLDGFIDWYKDNHEDLLLE